MFLDVHDMAAAQGQAVHDHGDPAAAEAAREPACLRHGWARPAAAFTGCSLLLRLLFTAPPRALGPIPIVRASIRAQSASGKAPSGFPGLVVARVDDKNRLTGS
jgi:hypothetical protein